VIPWLKWCGRAFPSWVTTPLLLATMSVLFDAIFLQRLTRGIIVDRNVFIAFERRGISIDLTLGNRPRKCSSAPWGAHDLIIAATALHRGASLLTDNIDEFSRVPNL